MPCFLLVRGASERRFREVGRALVMERVDVRVVMGSVLCFSFDLFRAVDTHPVDTDAKAPWR